MTQEQQLLDFNPQIDRNFEGRTPILDRWQGFLQRLVVAPSFVLGADLSHWNSSVNFAQLKAAGYEYVILKATESDYYVDPTFQSRWYQAVSEGLIVGAYHFFRSNKDGLVQADFHLKTIDMMLMTTNGVCIPPTNDVETEDGVSIATRQPRVLAWNNRVYSIVKKRPLCYTSPYMWQYLMSNAAMDCTSWTAHWTSSLTPSWPVGHPVDGRLFWQFGVYPKYSWALPVPTGVVGECDLNRFIGTRDQLLDYIGYEELTTEQKVDVLWTAHPELH